MNWYIREQIAENREKELESRLEARRRTDQPRRRPVQFWLLTLLRAWIVSPTR